MRGAKHEMEMHKKVSEKIVASFFHCKKMQIIMQVNEQTGSGSEGPSSLSLLLLLSRAPRDMHIQIVDRSKRKKETDGWKKELLLLTSCLSRKIKRKEKNERFWRWRRTNIKLGFVSLFFCLEMSTRHRYVRSWGKKQRMQPQQRHGKTLDALKLHRQSQSRKQLRRRRIRGLFFGDKIPFCARC